MSETHDETKHVATRSRARQIRDEMGNYWIVREAIAMYDRRESRTLVFMSDEIMRRVRNYPPDWFSWSEKDLFTLSLRPWNES